MRRALAVVVGGAHLSIAERSPAIGRPKHAIALVDMLGSLFASCRLQYLASGRQIVSLVIARSNLSGQLMNCYCELFLWLVKRSSIYWSELNLFLRFAVCQRQLFCTRTANKLANENVMIGTHNNNNNFSTCTVGSTILVAIYSRYVAGNGGCGVFCAGCSADADDDNKPDKIMAAAAMLTEKCPGSPCCLVATKR